MFIRQAVTINRKTKTKYIAHRLVESYQTPRGPRQRVVMHLGALDLPKSEWPKLAAILEAKLAGQISLFELGPELVAQVTWEQLGFDFILGFCDLSVEQKALAKAAIIRKINRSRFRVGHLGMAQGADCVTGNVAGGFESNWQESNIRNSRCVVAV